MPGKLKELAEGGGDSQLATAIRESANQIWLAGTRSIHQGAEGRHENLRVIGRGRRAGSKARQEDRRGHVQRGQGENVDLLGSAVLGSTGAGVRGSRRPRSPRPEHPDPEGSRHALAPRRRTDRGHQEALGRDGGRARTRPPDQGSRGGQTGLTASGRGAAKGGGPRGLTRGRRYSARAAYGRAPSGSIGCARQGSSQARPGGDPLCLQNPPCPVDIHSTTRQPSTPWKCNRRDC